MNDNTTSERFYGLWRLVSSDADGMIYYDQSGSMCVQSCPKRSRPRAGEKPTSAEALNALDGYVAYFGRYTIDERASTVTHHQTGTVQPGAPIALVRRYEFVDDKLILRPVDREGQIVWQRISGVRHSGSGTTYGGTPL